MEKYVSNPFFVLVGIASVLGSTLSCGSFTRPLEGDGSTGVEGYGQESPSVDDREADTPLTACPGILGRILTHAAGIEDAFPDTGVEPDQVSLVTYAVDGDHITELRLENVPADLRNYQADGIAHQEIWEYFTTLVPLEARESVLAEYSLMTDGVGNELAVVTQTGSDPARWVLSVDIADTDDKLYLTYTFIHELAHLLTLGPGQVKPSLAIFENPDDQETYYAEAGACPDYFPGEGCSLPDSYLNIFFTEFWADINEEWGRMVLFEDDAAYYEALDDFYYGYRDRFLTVYAATNPEEDIAESFTIFILSPKPAGESLAEGKILFFYRYPELVNLRKKILEAICRLNQ
jgi:hypothetical protein